MKISKDMPLLDPLGNPVGTLKADGTVVGPTGPIGTVDSKGNFTSGASFLMHLGYGGSVAKEDSKGPATGSVTLDVGSARLTPSMPMMKLGYGGS